jgi:hypothetical protein
MAQTRDLAAFNLDKETIIFNSLYTALDLLALLEVRQ